MSSGDDDVPELSVVLPCLNEADTLAVCLAKARRALEEHGIRGEIIVADNGSTDASVTEAEKAGARVVRVAERGYGNALMGGIAAARGRCILIGDADDSYDFGEIPAFVAGLRQGNDLVQGCRLARGGGRILPGAMPALHRYLGNPLLSHLARRWFGTPVNDVYCGMRAFRRELVETLGLRCTGMEFATEMIIKAALSGARTAEVPITLHPDGRRSHRPHLKTFRDGWRTLRLFLLCSPGRLYVVPGLTLVALGLAGYLLGMPSMRIRGVRFEAHTLLFASLAIICGYQSLLFAFHTKIFAIGARLLPEDDGFERWLDRFRLERGLAAGALVLAAGSALLLTALLHWRAVGFGDLDYARTLKWVIPGATLTVLGVQTVLAAFFASILQLRRR